MKGIFLKNWIVMWGGLRFNLVLMTIVGLIIAVVGQMNTFGSIFSGFFLCSMVMCMMEYNERSKWELYSDALPVGRKGTVKGFYLFSISYFAAFSVLAVLACVLFTAFMPMYFDPAALILTPIMTIFVPTLIFALTLPVLFKFGYKVFRVIFLVFLGFFGGIGGFFLGFLVDDEHSLASSVLSQIWSVDIFSLLPWILAVAAAVLALYFLSMLLSSKLYKTVEQ
ncbi:MAG: ABC-2 transporter permease [Acutalibacteraceae bacterium]